MTGVGDVIATAEEFAALPDGAIAVRPNSGILRRVWGSVLQQDVQAFLPATLVWLPGHPPRPERVVKAEALREWIAEWPPPKGLGLAFLAELARAGRARADYIERGEP